MGLFANPQFPTRTICQATAKSAKLSIVRAVFVQQWLYENTTPSPPARYVRHPRPPPHRHTRHYTCSPLLIDTWDALRRLIFAKYKHILCFAPYLPPHIDTFPTSSNSRRGYDAFTVAPIPSYLPIPLLSPGTVVVCCALKTGGPL